MECLERFDFDGLVSKVQSDVRSLNEISSRVQSDVRSMDEIAIAIRRAEKKSADASIGVGASKVAGGILTGIGICKYSYKS